VLKGTLLALLLLTVLAASAPVLRAEEKAGGGAFKTGRKLKDPLGNIRTVVTTYDIMFNTWGLKTAEIFDLTAAVIMVQSESCNFQPLHLDVITDNGPTLGQTIVVPNTEPNIHVCLEPNVDQVKQNLNETFSP